MRILVSGASGWIGSASVTELISVGHNVLGLARNDESAAKIAKLGADVVRGSLDDLDSLRTAAAQADRAAIEVFADALQGTGGPLLVASGTMGLATGRVGIEEDMPNAGIHPRIANAAYTLGLADRGIRADRRALRADGARYRRRSRIHCGAGADRP